MNVFHLLNFFLRYICFDRLKRFVVDSIGHLAQHLSYWELILASCRLGLLHWTIGILSLRGVVPPRAYIHWARTFTLIDIVIRCYYRKRVDIGVPRHLLPGYAGCDTAYVSCCDIIHHLFINLGHFGGPQCFLATIQTLIYGPSPSNPNHTGS